MRVPCGRIATASGVVLVVALLGSCTGAPGRSGGTAPPPRQSAASPTGSVGMRPDPAWRQLPDAPTERLEVAAAAVGDRIYVAGGLTPGAVTDVVEVFDMRSGTWRRGPDLPVPLHHASGLAWGSAFVVAGGFRPGTGGLFAHASDAVFALGCPPGFKCPHGRQGWIRLPPMPRPRGAAAAALVAGRLVVAGGQANGRLVAETDVFEPAGRRWSQGAAIPTARDHLGGATDGRHLYAIGGRRLSMGSVLGTVERYDPQADRWTRLADMPTPRGGLAAAYVPGERCVAAVGGETAGGTFDEVECYSIPSARWARLAPLPSPRHGLGLVAAGSRLFALAGGPRAGASVSADAWSLDLASPGSS